jgi:hypothetical protein
MIASDINMKFNVDRHPYLNPISVSRLSCASFRIKILNQFLVPMRSTRLMQLNCHYLTSKISRFNRPVQYQANETNATLLTEKCINLNSLLMY